MSRCKWLVVLTALVTLAVPTAQTYANISEAAVLFLRIASGARPAGMGEAFVALADDATATHWNPAGLGRYPLSDLWLNVPAPTDRIIDKFAVVENDVPERNYTRYDIWILTQATAGYFTSDEFDHPSVTPVNVPAEGATFKLEMDGLESGSMTVPGGTYGSTAALQQAVQTAIDAVLLESGVKVLVVASGDRCRLRIISGTTGDRSRVQVIAEAPPAFLAGGSSRQGNYPELLRATPPSHNSQTGSSDLNKSWKTGDTYEPDASENLLGILKSRTGLPEGEELNARVAQVARLNQLVPTDSLKKAWEAVKTLAKAAVPETLTVNMQTLFDANDVLNADAGYLADLVKEMEAIVKAGRFEDDDAFRLQVLAGRAVDIVQPETLSMGGIGGARKAAALAEAAEAFVALHQAQSPYNTAINAHIHSTIPNFLIQECFDDFLEPWARDLMRGVPRVKAGYLEPSDAPGIGVEFDEKEMSRHPYGPNNFLRLFENGWEKRTGGVPK